MPEARASVFGARRADRLGGEIVTSSRSGPAADNDDSRTIMIIIIIIILINVVIINGTYTTFKRPLF